MNLRNFRCAALGALAAASALSQAQANTSQTFIENKGQWNETARFLATSGNLNLWITPQGAVYDYHVFVPDKSAAKTADKIGGLPPGKAYGHVIKTSFVGSQASPTQGAAAQDGVLNYFLGGRSATGVRRFSEVRATQLYPGISERWYFDQGAPRYDIMVAPGADPSTVKMKVEGANGLTQLANGDVRIDTSLGPIEERGLAVYQVKGQAKVPISAKMVVEKDIVRFQVGNYDRSSTLVIDPLVYSTYLGGRGSDLIFWNGVTRDTTGKIVVCGTTFAPDFPTTTGAYSKDKGGHWNSFVTKMSADGSHLIFSTCVGGTQNYYPNEESQDRGNAVLMDSSGNAYVCGVTDSIDFPVTPDALKPTGGTPFDAFYYKVSADGSQLLYSTYIGGSDYDEATGMAFDKSGNTVIVGRTNGGFPTTPGAYSQTGWAFVMKLSPQNKVIFSTETWGAPLAMALDADDNIAYCGWVNEDIHPTPSAFRSTPTTFFVSKLSKDGTALLYSSYLGGIYNDAVHSITIDSSGSMIVAGVTTDPNFPVTPGAFQTKHTPYGDGFLTKFSPDGSTLVFSTLMGGSGGPGDYSDNYEGFYSVRLDAAGNIVAVGQSTSADYPVTSGAFQNKIAGGKDAVLSKFSPSGALLYSTFLGGSLEDYAWAVSFDASGNPVVVGDTASRNFPTTSGAFQRTYGGDWFDTFITDISLAPVLRKVAANPASVVATDTAQGTVHFEGENDSGLTVNLSSNNANVQVPATITLPAGKVDGSFSITTLQSADPATVTVSATYASLTLKTQFAVEGILSGLSSNGPTAGGRTIVGTVSLKRAAVSPLLVNLTSDPALQVPATVTIPQGSKTATFPIKTSGVSTNSSANITGTYGTQSVGTTVSLYPCDLASMASLVPLPVLAGKQVPVIVNLTGAAPTGGITVALSSDNAVAGVPSTMMVPAGSTHGYFNVSTVPANAPATAKITASLNNRQVTLQVQVAEPGFDIVMPSSTSGGRKVAGDVAFSVPTAQSTAISLESDNPSVHVPTSIQIGAGSSHGGFVISADPVSASTTANIRATVGQQTKTASITVNPAALSYLTARTPSTVVGGQTITVMVVLDGIAGSGAVVNLSSNNAAASVPATVTVPAGTTHAYFVVTTNSVTAPTTATITATLGTSQATTVVHVTP